MLAQALVLLLAALSCARADAPGMNVVVERGLDETLTAALLALDGLDAGRIAAAGSEAVCAELPSGTPRLAVIVHQPRSRQIEACREQAAAKVLAVTIGYQAIALVTPADTPVFSLHSSDLFRAIAKHAGETAAPAVWRDIETDLPALPVGLLAPAAGSAAERLLTATVLEPACRRSSGAPVPFGLTDRIDFCGALRADPAIIRRLGGSREIVDWAASAPAGQLAVVGLAELRALDRAVVPLPLDDLLPTAANVLSGRYPAAEPITLLIVLPHATAPAGRGALRQAAFELLSERAIGPEGTLVLAGLLPVPPSERVALRSRVIAFVERP